MMKNDGDYVREKSIAAAHIHYTRDFELFWCLHILSLC